MNRQLEARLQALEGKSPNGAFVAVEHPNGMVILSNGVTGVDNVLMTREDGREMTKDTPCLWIKVLNNKDEE